MKKYITLLYVAWENIVAYRWANLLYFSFSLINVFLSIAIWSIAYKNPQFNSTVSYTTFIYYLMFVLVIQTIGMSRIGESIASRYIKRGEFSMLLLKPFSPFLYLIIVELPWRIMQCFFAIPVVTIALLLFRLPIVVEIGWVLGALLILPFTYLLSFFIQSIFGFTAFWFEDADGIFNFLEFLLLLFGGMGIPLFFFPQALRDVSTILPFQYILYFPAMIALHTAHDPIPYRECIMLLFWLLCMGFIVRFMWKKGLEHYTGEGI